MALASLVAVASCQKDTKVVYHEPTTFVLNTPAFASGIYDLENSTSVVFTCSQPDYGFTAATTYKMEFSLDQQNWTALSKTSSTAKIDVDAAALAGLLGGMLGIPEEQYPVIRTVYARATANLTASGLGTITSNVVTLNSVRIHFVPVDAPKTMNIVGGGQWLGDWNWDNSLEMVAAYGLTAGEGEYDGTFWRLVYFDANAAFKFNVEKKWDGGEAGYAAVEGRINDNANAGITKTDDGNIVVTNPGWYLFTVRTEISGRDYIYTVDFDEPTVYLLGTAVDGCWDIPNDYVFTVPDGPDGEFVSPAFTTDATEGVRCCVKLSDRDWWKSEFIIKDGKISYRGVGPDQDRVPASKGQKISFNFFKGTGHID